MGECCSAGVAIIGAGNGWAGRDGENGGLSRPEHGAGLAVCGASAGCDAIRQADWYVDRDCCAVAERADQFGECRKDAARCQFRLIAGMEDGNPAAGAAIDTSDMGRVW